MIDIRPSLAWQSLRAAVARRQRAREEQISSWAGCRVTLMGLGHHGGGVGAARYLARQGAIVTISDAAKRDSLEESLRLLVDVPIAAIKLGSHDDEDFRAADYVVVNPAVRPDHSCLRTAREGGATLTSEIEIFLRACRGKMIGVTGSNGKSTTCAMLTDILTAAGRRTWLGGNFGGSLLGDVDGIDRRDWVVLELSSFQLAHLSARAPLPRIAVVTNCQPNHLDWHGSFDAYQRAKQRIVAGQPRNAIAVLGDYERQSHAWSRVAGGRMIRGWPAERIGRLAVPGEHNRRNAAMAAAAAEAAGVDLATILLALKRFTGLEHRLQIVAEVAGRRFYNDSKSTTPHATLAALAAIDQPLWLLAGGQSKGASFNELAGAIASRVRGVALFGAARHELAARTTARGETVETMVSERMDDALRWCWQRSRAGDAILFSPACASYDQFRDFAARGEMFCRLVRTITAQ